MVYIKDDACCLRHSSQHHSHVLQHHATCPPPPPPPTHTHTHTMGELTEFQITSNGNRGSVTLFYGYKRKKKTSRKKPCAPEGVGPKPADQLTAAVPSFVPVPAHLGASGAAQGWVRQNRRRFRLLCRSQPSQERQEQRRGGGKTGGGPVCKPDPDFAIQ